MSYIATPDGDCWRHVGGQLLGTSGSGDVLAGIIVGLAARGAPLEQAAVWGVALHARAGQALAERLGPIGYLARELPAQIPMLLDQLAH
jgi:NAD(P)H-hydrate repair Nnr-like enzyme with NAD(P)H-hydrate dehydratase domain